MVGSSGGGGGKVAKITSLATEKLNSKLMNKLIKRSEFILAFSFRLVFLAEQKIIKTSHTSIRRTFVCEHVKKLIVTSFLATMDLVRSTIFISDFQMTSDIFPLWIKYTNNWFDNTVQPWREGGGVVRVIACVVKFREWGQ